MQRLLKRTEKRIDKVLRLTATGYTQDGKRLTRSVTDRAEELSTLKRVTFLRG